MPWVANNNQAGEFRLPSHAAFLKSHGAPSPFQSFRAELVDHRTPFCVYLNPSHRVSSDDLLYIHPRTHAQFVAQVVFDARVPLESIWCSQEQLANFEMCHEQIENWRWYNSTKDPIAAAISVEIRPLHPSTTFHLIDTLKVTNAFLAASTGKIVTENERVVFQVDANDYFLRIVAMEADDPNETEFTMPNIFRSKVTTCTTIELIKENPDDTTYALSQESTKKTKAITAKGTVVEVWTSDDEVFPVKKKLLWPCIKLTSAVMAGFGVHKDNESIIHVDVDCCTFDRVLLYLEHSVLYPDQEFQFDPNVTDVLLQAAITVGCQGLEDLCRMRLGEFQSRVRKQAIPYSLVVEKNNVAKETWLIMDGMVFDITRWLPEHPGGSSIIPTEALNIDCVGMFEIYHASKASFRYLKQFYIGEIDEKERELIPNGHTNPRIPLPSSGFMEELAQYTKWRIKPEPISHISF